MKRRREPPVEEKTVVGWKEFISFPEWGVRRLKAKIDTGARTSALDVLDYQLLKEDGKILVEFRLALNRKEPERIATLRVPVLALVVIKNSAGQPEQRPLVETLIKVGKATKRIQLTLSDRQHMRFRMLIGRKALESDFIVDVSRKYVNQRKPKSEPGT